MAATRTAKPPKLPESAESVSPPTPVNTHLGASVYWKALGALIVVSAVLSGGEPSAILLVLLLGMPAIQLGASLIAAIYLACSSNPDKKAGLRQIRSITLWTFLGGLIGIGAMALVPVFLK
jgi:hypothetical protein